MSEQNWAMPKTEDAEFLIKINALRDERINAGVEYPVDSQKMYDSNEESQKNINGVVTMALIASSAGQPFEQNWISQDNTVVVLDANAAIGLGVTIGKHVGFHRLQARVYKDRIKVATTQTDIDVIVAEYEAL